MKNYILIFLILKCLYAFLGAEVKTLTGTHAGVVYESNDDKFILNNYNTEPGSVIEIKSMTEIYIGVESLMQGNVEVYRTDVEDITLDFNDAVWDEAIDTDPPSVPVTDFEFGDTEAEDYTESTWVEEQVQGSGLDENGDQIDNYGEVKFTHNDTWGTSLNFNIGVNQNTHIKTEQYIIGLNRILIEARVKFSSLKEGDYLSLMEFNSIQPGQSLSFNIGKVTQNQLVPFLSIQNGADVYATEGIDTWENQWVQVGIEVWVDSSAATDQYFVRFFNNSNELAGPPQADITADWVWNDFFGATVNTKSLKRNFNDVAFDVDFVRIKQLEAPFQTGPDSGDSYAGEMFVTDNSSVSVVLDANRLSGPDVEADYFIVKRISDPPSKLNDLNNGSEQPNRIDEDTPSKFHGLFEINFGLVVEDFAGSINVDIFVKKESSVQYKQIGTKIVTVSMNSGISWQQYYWNARAAFGEGDSYWNQDDANVPFDENIEFRFFIR